MAKRIRGENNIYGETPYSVLCTIGRKTGLQRDSHYLDVGSGRGKGIFFMREKFSCKASGVEWVEPFVRRAKGIERLFAIDKISFVQESMEKTSFSGVDVVYAYSTCFSEEELSQLAEKADQLLPGSYLVSVSVEIASYSPFLKLVDRFTASYPWGKTEVYIQKKI